MTMMQILPEFNELWQKTLFWQPERSQQEQLQQLYQGILTGNQQLNLTRITQPQDFWEKHLWDSLAGVMGEGLPIELNANNSLKAIDIGTGGGFPGIPIAIALSNWQITLLDSTRKKVNFLADLVPQLQLNNIQTLLGRAEEIGLHPLHKNYYDLALIRAVGSPEICTKYTWYFLKPNGLAILYRGTWQQEDTTNLVAILKKMSGEIENIKEFTTPLTNSIRHCIYLRKK